MDSFVALCDHRLDPLQVGALGGPVTRRPRSVLIARQDDGGDSVCQLLVGGVEHRHLFSRGDVHRQGSCLPDEFVHETDVCEGSAHHDLVVASSGSLRVEIQRFHAVVFELLCGRRVVGNLSCWGDVVGRD